MEIPESHFWRKQTPIGPDANGQYLREDDNEKRFRIVLESVPSGIVMTDSAGLIVLCNAETEKMFGYASGELNGRSIDILVPAASRSRHVADRSGYVAHPTKRQMGAGRDLRGVRKDGSEFSVEIGLNHLQNKSGMFVVGTIVDITERKETEEKLRRVYEQIRQKNQEMEQFVYTASHDLKSPLVTSMSFLGFLREDIQSGNQVDIYDSLDRLEKAYRKMQELIEDLLELSRVGTVELKLEKVALLDIVRVVREYANERLNEKGISFEFAADLPTVTGDRKRIHQVIENLVSNAIKYGVMGTSPSIHIIWRETDSEFQVAVKDNGAGIDKQYHKKIFDLFQRLRTDQEGTGVGLSIVARAMQLHGGRAWVESSPQCGAEFWVSFPKSMAGERA
jgi:PAS domain S-box-containing protein